MDNNRFVYSTPAALKWYKHQHGLMPAEKQVFEELKNQFPAFKILDLGIGSGRTTGFLLTAGKKYTGIDYSESLINHARTVYPQADLHLMDARNLSYFDPGTFDLVNFSFNGIDYVTPEDREKILAEVSRVLKPGGIFFFSTHNKAHFSFSKTPWRNKAVSPLVNFKTFLRLLPFLPRHVLKKNREYYCENYAIVNDTAHNYSLLTHYTTPRFLKEQLSHNGFTKILFRSKTGARVPEHLLDDWIFVTCQRSTL